MKNISKWMIGIGAIVLIAAFISAKDRSFMTSAQSKPTVVVTIAPQAAFIREVAGDLVNVVTVLPPGANHETYSPPPQDMAQMSNAALYLSLGLPPERSNILPKLTEMNRNMKIIDVQNEVGRSYTPRFFAPDDQDPHIWLSPKRAILMVQVTARELGLLDPANRELYATNSQRYIGQIEAADREARELLSPMANRTFIVYHPAFGYFADDYNLTMVALEEEGKEADPRRMREIIDMVS